MNLLLAAALAAVSAPAQAPAPASPPATAVSPAAQELGEQLAGSGTLAALLPLMVAKETAEMVAAHPDLTPAEQAELKRIAATTAQAGTARVMAALGRAYASRLTLEQMGTIIAFNETDAAKAYRAATPAAIAETMQVMGTIDFKGETMAAFCKATGKGCEKD